MGKEKYYKKHLEKEKFYSVNKHPSLIIFKNDKKNIYLAVVTGATKKKALWIERINRNENTP